jgi:hypothetical protein
VYCEAARVRHPARRLWSEIVRQARRHAGGRFDWHRTSEPYRYTSLRFWRAVWHRLFPKFGEMRRARGRLAALGYGWLDWLRVCAVILGVQYAAAFEFLRIKLGFAPERR